jgi:integrase/recombinase XerC
MIIRQFIHYLQFEKRCSLHTIQAYHSDLDRFHQFIKSNYDFDQLENVNHDMIRSWVIDLIDQGLIAISVNRKISTLKSFYNYLLKQGRVTSNPAKGIHSLRTPKRLPVCVNEEQMSEILDRRVEGDIDFSVLRDHLVIELLYTTGMRRGELLSLKESSIDINNLLLKVHGKRNKERLIPLSKQLMEQIELYMEIKKKTFEKPNDFFIVTDKGNRAYPELIYRIAHRALIGTASKRKSPHVLRHSFATHMLNKGAELNTIKEILGHASLAATQVYTHSTIDQLKTIYHEAHPRAKLK